jgi:hypothetical protein
VLILGTTLATNLGVAFLVGLIIAYAFKAGKLMI